MFRLFVCLFVCLFIGTLPITSDLTTAAVAAAALVGYVGLARRWMDNCAFQVHCPKLPNPTHFPQARMSFSFVSHVQWRASCSTVLPLL